jgi:serine/threonine-protein kinase
MELLEGESLAARIDRAGPMPPAEAARVVTAVANALQAAHTAGVVHRDVKPGNVFLTTAGEVKVLDFGIAWCAHHAALTTGELLGTAAYLAPERVLGHRATPATDIYALGVVLYELLAGHRPFEASSEVELAMAHVNASPPSLREVAPATPPFLVAACHQAMAKDPSARPPSAAAFANLVQGEDRGSTSTRPLRVAAAPVPGATPAVPAPPLRSGLRRPRPRRRRLLVALLLAGALLAALPALPGGLPLVRERIEGPLAVLEPGSAPPPSEAPQEPSATDATPEPGAQPADDPGPPAFSDPGANSDRRSDSDDRDQDDDSSGPGRSGGGDSGGGGSSGPG